MSDYLKYLNDRWYKIDFATKFFVVVLIFCGLINMRFGDFALGFTQIALVIVGYQSQCAMVDKKEMLVEYQKLWGELEAERAKNVNSV